MATLLLARDAGNTVVHKAGNPGIGKTYIIFLLCYMLREEDPGRVIYLATINDVLRDQLAAQAGRFGIELRYLTPAIFSTLKKPSIVVFDEYMQGLLNEHFSLDSKGKLNGIWGMHEYCDQMFLFSGEHSTTLERVVKRLLPIETKVSMLHEWASLGAMIGTGATQDVKVIAAEDRTDRDALFLKWMQEEEQAGKPMMVFGADEEVQKMFESVKRPTKKGTTEEELERIQRGAQNMTETIVFLADEFGCGVDISFRVNPKVVILCEGKPPSRYQFMQYAGRAQRGDVWPVCTVFSTTGMDSALNLQSEIMREDKAPLKEMEQCIELYEDKKVEITTWWKKAIKQKTATPKVRFCNQVKAFKDVLEDKGVIQ